MKIPGFVKFIVFAVLAFGFGVGLAKWQQAHKPDEVIVEKPHAIASETETASSLKKPTPQSPEKPATPSLPSPGQVVADAPPAPQPLATPIPSPTVAGEPVGGPFLLIDQKGNSVTEQSWPGKYKLVFFGFTSCPDTCPATLQKMSVVMENYDSKGAKLQPLFITTDPAHDTKEILSTYIGGYDSHILGLTGTKEQIDAVEKTYRVFVSQDQAGRIDHSAYIYLMSPDDKLLEVISPDLSAKEMIAKIRPHTDAKAPEKVAAPKKP